MQIMSAKNKNPVFNETLKQHKTDAKKMIMLQILFTITDKKFFLLHTLETKNSGNKQIMHAMLTAKKGLHHIKNNCNNALPIKIILFFEKIECITAEIIKKIKSQKEIVCFESTPQFILFCDKIWTASCNCFE